MARRGPRPALRLVALLSAMGLLLMVVAGRLFYLQAVEANLFEQLGARQRVRAIDLPAKRGTIYDRRMQPLAISVEARAVFANPRVIGDPAVAAASIAPIIGADPAALEARLRQDRGFVYLARKVAPDVADKVVALGFPGVETAEETRRGYPGGTLAGQIVGFAGTDDVGLAGIESGRDAVLRGTPGRHIVERDPYGRPIPQGRNWLREPVPGRSVVLTIDGDMQFAAERALARAVLASGARGGSAVVLEPRSGDVLAMANYPFFDPNEFRTADESRWRNRAVTDVYEPGSVVKAITAAAAIENKAVGLEDPFDVPDHIRIGSKVFKDYRSHKPKTLTLPQILAESSNVGTIKVAQRLGRDPLYRAMVKFGLGRVTGAGFPGEASGILAPSSDWYDTSMGTVPIGQGVAVTPLQIAAAYAVFANDGVFVRPRLVRGVVDDEGTLLRGPRSPRRRAVSARTAAQVRAMLVGVVEEGTGRHAKISGYAVGGKTGTARQPRKSSRGYGRQLFTTFAGIAPAERPRVVVVVALDNPGIRFASVTAAPAWREIVQHSLARLGVVPPLAPRSGSTLAARRTR